MRSNQTVHPMGHEDEADVRRSEVQELAVSPLTSHLSQSQPALRGACGWGKQACGAAVSSGSGRLGLGGRHFGGPPGQTQPIQWRLEQPHHSGTRSVQCPREVEDESLGPWEGVGIVVASCWLTTTTRLRLWMMTGGECRQSTKQKAALTCHCCCHWALPGLQLGTGAGVLCLQPA